MINFDSAALRGGTSRKRNLFSHVVEDLGSRIVRGEFKPGAALPNEADLGQEFEASRSVIREAVKALAAKGMLELRTRTGIRVLSPIHWNLLDPEVLSWRYSAMPPAQFLREIFEIRGLIEPPAAAFSAERATKADIAEIASAYEAMEAADQPGAAAITADLRFHRAVLAGAHNHLLLQMGNLIGVGLTVSYGLSSNSFEVFLPRHKDVLDAVAARKPNVAHDAMQRLLGDTRTYLDKQFNRPSRKQPRGTSKRPARTAALA